MHPIAFIAETFIFLVVVAVAFGAVTLLASFIRFHLLTHRIEKAAADDIDPQDRFQLRLIQELGSLHQDPHPFSLFLLEPVIPPEMEERHGESVIDNWMNAFQHRVQEGLRADDFVSRLGPRQVGILARVPIEQVPVLAERVQAHIQKTAIKSSGGMAFKWPAAMGVAAYPEHGERAADLMQQLQVALETAKTAATRRHVPPVADAGTKEGPSDASSTRSPDQRGVLDALTGVLREDRLPTALQKFAARQRKLERGVSVCFLSIDLFDQYREHYDERIANELLKGLADVLAARTRETDVLARAGEAEFVVVMGCAPVSALSASQRLVAEVKRVPFRFGSTQLRVTLSAGVAGYPDHTGSGAEMLAYAETAMKAARERGRNVSLLYHPTMDRPAPQRRRVDTF